MNKRTFLIVSAGSIGLALLGILVPAISLVATSNIPQMVLLVGTVLFLLGGLAGAAAWVAGLIKAAAVGQWGWFVAIALFNVVGALAYALQGSERGSERGAAVA
jgi:hypothetical protein